MKVPNTQRRFGETNSYVLVKINGQDALLTQDAAAVGIARAKRQREDVPSVGTRVLDWLKRL